MSLSIIANIRASRLLTVLLSSMLAMACLSIYLFLASLQVLLALRLLVCACASLLMLLQARRYIRQQWPVQLMISDTHAVVLIYPDDQLPVMLDRHSIIWPGLMALRFITEQGKPVYLMLLPDATDEASFHRLKVGFLYMKKRRSPDAS